MPIAVKNGEQKTFSDVAWKMLGKNKNGWEELSTSISENIISKSEKPSTGEKAKPTVQVVENTVGKEEVKVSEVIAEVITELKNEEVVDLKAIFFDVIKSNDITKNQLKNYLDSKEISYQTKDNLETLSDLMYKELNGDIAELKLTLSI